MTEIREEWAAKARENLDTCSALATEQDRKMQATTEVYTHDATLPFSMLQKSDAVATANLQPRESDEQRDGAGACVPEDVDAVVMNPPWGKRIGNLSLEHSEEGAIVRSLLLQFVRNSRYLGHQRCSDIPTHRCRDAGSFIHCCRRCCLCADIGCSMVSCRGTPYLWLSLQASTLASKTTRVVAPRPLTEADEMPMTGLAVGK